MKKQTETICRGLKVLMWCWLLVGSSVAYAWQREPVWPRGKMPNPQPHQIAAMTDEAGSADFKPAHHREAYIEWFDEPKSEVRNGACMILISGGSYENCCDVGLIHMWRERLTALGFQCVNLVYRTPRPQGLPIYQSAWEDGQRAVRLIRSEAAKRKFDPERIGVISMSAGSHLALLLATSSQTRSYQPVDRIDSIGCHINWAVANAPAYATTDAESGIPASRMGYGSDVVLSRVFKFDSLTCPISLHHGGTDIYSPNGSTLVYRRLRQMGVGAELHLYPNCGHGAYGFDRGIEFMRQLGVMGSLASGQTIMSRFASDSCRAELQKENVWPDGRMPNPQDHQCTPYIEWHTPKHLKTKAIQIVYSGGSYEGNDPNGFEVAPVRRYLNERGMTVVTLRYRTPRPQGLAKHTTAWQDLQRTIKLVRHEAEKRGLDPNQIGVMGSSAGGHLTLMATTSALHQSYEPLDDIDRLPCHVQWGVGIYPAYVLSDGSDGFNQHGGNLPTDIIMPEFNFDLKTAPMLFLHGDADGYASMGSVKVWERMRAMGIQSELHTLCGQAHCFQQKAAPQTASYNWLDRIYDFLRSRVKFE